MPMPRREFNLSRASKCRYKDRKKEKKDPIYALQQGYIKARNQ
jgi:hypothetical protein